METVRIGVAQINTIVGDIIANSDKIIAYTRRAASLRADMVVFPELAVTGYPPEDLLLQPRFVRDNVLALKKIAAAVRGVTAIIGFVDRQAKALYNAAAVVTDGRVKGIYHKELLPNYGVFDEVRYFTRGGGARLFRIGRTAFGVNICEDIWHLNGPAGLQVSSGARFIVNINASPYHRGKGLQRESILRRQARRYRVPIVYTNLVGGQDELVFDGSSFIVDALGRVIAKAAAFREELLMADVAVKPASRKSGVSLGALYPKTDVIRPRKVHALSQTAEVYEALVLGLRDYIVKNGFKKVVLGLSGGIDSSLVAAIAADAVGAAQVVGVSMPSVYTSSESKEDAQALAKNLGLEFLTVPIQEIFQTYLEVLKLSLQGRPVDITEENLQARVRGNIIMALSNKFGYLALNTGNKSEVSCGYCTLYGDMAGGFGVIKDVPKTMVYALAAYRNEREGREVIPRRVFTKAPTAELRHNQKDSDSLPEYSLLDRVLKAYVEEDKGLDEIVRRGIPRDVARRVLRLVDASEYKRRQAPPGIKITPKAFGRDRRMPITNGYR